MKALKVRPLDIWPYGIVSDFDIYPPSLWRIRILKGYQSHYLIGFYQGVKTQKQGSRPKV
jgi:hypothetical protein